MQPRGGIHDGVDDHPDDEPTDRHRTHAGARDRRVEQEERREREEEATAWRLAEAIEKEGFEVLGATIYGDLSQFAQQQSRASAFILSIDDEEFTPGPELDPAVVNLRKFIEEIRWP